MSRMRGGAWSRARAAAVYATRSHSLAARVHNARADDALVRSVFDDPSLAQARTAAGSAPSGLFGHEQLRTPDAVIHTASGTTVEAARLVDQICAGPSPTACGQNAEQRLLYLVKLFDQLSDLLCGVIDLSELVRNVHPDPEWAAAAETAYVELCNFMNTLNVHVGLYSVRLMSVLGLSVPR